jgi:hypothetical protein
MCGLFKKHVLAESEFLWRKRKLCGRMRDFLFFVYFFEKNKRFVK